MKNIIVILGILTFFSKTNCYSLDKSNENVEFGHVTGFKTPRFVTLKSREVNMRSGPGINYPVKINYKCFFLPVEIIAEFETWRLIRDSNSNEGWVHEAMLSGKRYVQINEDCNASDGTNEYFIFRLPNERSRPIARVKINMIGKLMKCNVKWCKVKVGHSHKGWICKDKLWGIYHNEVI